MENNDPVVHHLGDLTTMVNLLVRAGYGTPATNLELIATGILLVEAINRVHKTLDDFYVMVLSEKDKQS